MWSKAWWKATAERVLSTGAGALIAVWATDGVTDLAEVGWESAASVAGFAMLVSFLKALIASGVGPDGGPSLTGEVLAPKALPADGTVHGVYGDDEPPADPEGRHRA